MPRTRATVLAAVALAGALTTGLSVPAAAAPAPSSGCAQVETIAVRGTSEPQGGGSIAGPLATAIQSQVVQTVQTYNLVYPASYNYTSSVQQGIAALKSRLQSTSTSCPNIRFVLIGYSQGAQVVGDTLAGGSVPAANKITAVTVFGDPAFNSAEPFDVGTFTPGRNGLNPRRTGALRAFASTIASYCRSDDNICQRGVSGSGHLRYAADRQTAVTFVAGKLGGGTRA